MVTAHSRSSRSRVVLSSGPRVAQPDRVRALQRHTRQPSEECAHEARAMHAHLLERGEARVHHVRRPEVLDLTARVQAANVRGAVVYASRNTTRITLSSSAGKSLVARLLCTSLLDQRANRSGPLVLRDRGESHQDGCQLISCQLRAETPLQLWNADAVVQL